MEKIKGWQSKEGEKGQRGGKVVEVERIREDALQTLAGFLLGHTWRRNSEFRLRPSCEGREKW